MQGPIEKSKSEDGKRVYEVVPKDGFHEAPPCELFLFSSDGQYFALAEKEQVLVYHVESAKPQISITQRNVTAMHFSPSNTYLVTWHRKKGDESMSLSFHSLIAILFMPLIKVTLLSLFPQPT